MRVRVRLRMGEGEGEGSGGGGGRELVMSRLALCCRSSRILSLGPRTTLNASPSLDLLLSTFATEILPVGTCLPDLVRYIHACLSSARVGCLLYTPGHYAMPDSEEVALCYYHYYYFLPDMTDAFRSLNLSGGTAGGWGGDSVSVGGGIYIILRWDYQDYAGVDSIRMDLL